LLSSGFATAAGEREHRDGLDEQQRDGEEPVDVAVALVERDVVSV
jgi:hypothetical protein